MQRKTFFILVFAFLQITVFAQTQNDLPVHKEYLPNSYWLTLRYDHYFKSGSFLFFENNDRFSRNSISLGNSFPFNKTYRMYFMGGYEHKASEHWYLGFSEKIVLDPGVTTYYTRVNISHRGKFLGLRFIKEGAFEYMKFPKSNNANQISMNYGRVSFSPALIKDFKIAGRKFFLLLSYRAYMLFDFTNDGFSAYDKRFIDKTRLRLEVDYFLTERLLISFFTIRDTDYFYSSGTFDQYNNPITPAGPLNQVTPTIGFALNYVFNAPEDFIPGFPIK